MLCIDPKALSFTIQQQITFKLATVISVQLLLQNYNLLYAQM